MSEAHTPVMVSEVIEFFSNSHLKVFFDGTLGAGGHAEAILNAHPEIELYIGCDRDPAALAIAHERLAPFGKKVQFVHGNHLNLDSILASMGVDQVDGFFLT